MHFVASEKDPNDLIFCMAADGPALKTARRVLKDGGASDQVREQRLGELLNVYGLCGDYFDERLRIVVLALNLIERESSHYETLQLAVGFANRPLVESAVFISMRLAHSGSDFRIKQLNCQYY